MLNCLSLIPAGVTPLRDADCSHLAHNADGPPGADFIVQFFARHRAPLFLVGATGVLAGLAVIGLTAVFTVPAGLALLAFGIGAITYSCAANWLAASAGAAKTDDDSGKKIKPRGHRMYSRYLPRKKPGKPVAVEIRPAQCTGLKKQNPLL